MQLSTKTRYALRALIELGLHDGKPVLLKDVARAQGISLKYLDHIFALLRTQGYITTEGKGKGYALAKDAGQIKISDIVDIFEESVLVDCANNSGICKRTQSCAAENIWKRISLVLQKELNIISLADAIADQKKMSAKTGREKMYYI